MQKENGAKWVISTLVGILLFVTGIAARPLMFGSGLEGRVERLEAELSARPQYVTLKEQLNYAMKHGSDHTVISMELAGISTKLDILLSEHGIGRVQQ